MEIQTFVFNPFYENTYVLWDETKNALIIDPGCYEKYEIEELTTFISEKKLQIKAIVNTHCHIDHVLGNYSLKEIYRCPLLIPIQETEVLKAVEAYAPNWGIAGYTPAQPDHLIENDGQISFGNTDLKVMYAPGHSPGHQVFYHQEDKILIGGDVLFAGSVGRTDLPGGDHQTLMNSIRSVLYILPDETRVFPGHGPATTIGGEKRSNPFIQG